MQYVEGITLADEIARNGSITEEFTVQIFKQIADALDHAHEQHVLHRDIKPSNIMLVADKDQERRAVVLDFGIAKLQNENQALTKTGDVFGTPCYMSPEQCQGEKLDNRSDIYSLGCVMYEIFTGKTPFNGQSIVDIILKQVSEKPTPINSLAGAKFPNALERIIEKTLAKAPSERYQSVAELKEDLSKLSSSQYHIRLRSPGDFGRIGKIIACVLTAVLMIAGVWFFWRIANDRPQVSSVVKQDIDAPIAFDKQFEDLGDTVYNRIHRNSLENPGAIGKRDRMAVLKGLTPYDAMYPDKSAGSDGLHTMSDQVHRIYDPDERSAGEDAEISLDAYMGDVRKLGWRIKHRPDRFIKEFSANDSFIDDSIVSALKGNALHVLSLNNSKVTAKAVEDIAGFSELESLSLDGIALPHDALKRLMTLPDLSTLSVAGCGLDDESMLILSEHKFKQLILSGNEKITDKGVRYLVKKHVPELELNLSGTSITPAVLADMVQLKGLRGLWIYGIPVADADLPAIARIKTLEGLDLSLSKISDFGLRKFKPPSLKKLVLQKCVNVTSYGVMMFKRNCPHCSVYLGNKRRAI
jgi:ribosomal protein L29